MTENQQVEEKKPETPKKNGFAVAEMTFQDARLLKTLFEAIKRITDEPVFNISLDALSIRQMDPSRVAMINYNIEKAYFEEWHVHTPGICCFDLDEMLKVAFGNLAKDTRVGFFINGKDGQITITLKDSRIRKRQFPMLESTVENAPTPKLHFDAMFKLVAKPLQEDLAELAKVSDHAVLNGGMNSLKIEAIGDTTKGSNSYDKGSDLLIDAEVKTESKATYSLSYLTGMLFDPKLCDVVAFEFSTDMPIRVTMQTRFGNLYSYLAPRIACE